MNSDLYSVSLVETSGRPCGLTLVDSNRSIKSTDPMDLVDLAKEIQKEMADEFTRANATSKLSVIAEQARFLQEQARKVLEQAKRDDDLHHVACNLKKKPGQMYYLYHRSSNQRYFSLVSPQDWGVNCPHEFIGAFKLQHDLSWTAENDLNRRDDELKTLNKILDANAKLCIRLDNSEL